jgi:hypothetical protein
MVQLIALSWAAAALVCAVVIVAFVRVGSSADRTTTAQFKHFALRVGAWGRRRNQRRENQRREDTIGVDPDRRSGDRRTADRRRDPSALDL